MSAKSLKVIPHHHSSFTALRSKLRVVVLESFYDHVDDPLAQNLFVQMIRLKIQGYSSEYPYGVMPLDTIDFAATHHLICEERKEGLYVVSGLRTISLEKCRAHNIPFPVLSDARSWSDPDREREVRRILERDEGQNRNIVYGGGWTTDPMIRKSNRELAKLLSAFTMAIHLQSLYDLTPVSAFCYSVPRFKLDHLYAKYGYRRMAFENGSLFSECTSPALFGEKGYLMHLTEVSSFALTEMKDFREAWENRIIVGEPRTRFEKKAA